MKSLYGQYIKERQGTEIIEDSRGFCTYFYINDGVYLQDIYVAPSHRHEKVASQYADKIAIEAKEKGFKKMYGSVVPTVNNSTDGLKVLISYGFRLHSAENNAVIMVKDI